MIFTYISKNTKGADRKLYHPRTTEHSNDIDYSQYEGIIKVLAKMNRRKFCNLILFFDT